MCHRWTGVVVYSLTCTKPHTSRGMHLMSDQGWNNPGTPPPDPNAPPPPPDPNAPPPDPNAPPPRPGVGVPVPVDPNSAPGMLPA